MLAPERLADPASRARLMREARVASALSHPNIAVIYEIDEVDSGQGPRSCIAMEYVPGRTLAEHVRAHALEAVEVVALVRQVAEALAEAHQHGVIHRDVKPSNVMVNQSSPLWPLLPAGTINMDPFQGVTRKGFSTRSREQ